MLSTLEADNAGLKLQMLAALKNVQPGYLLDQQLVATLGFGGKGQVS